MMYENISIDEMRQAVEKVVPALEKFSSRDVDNELDVRSRKGKQYRAMVLKEMTDAGLLEKDGQRFRYIANGHDDEIDWQTADSGNSVDLKWPFQLHDWIKIYPKSVIILAGESGAGKTAYLYNFILLNQKRDDIILWSNDMGAEEMAERFINFETPISVPAPWKTFERHGEFGDVVRKYPDAIHVIDYLDLNSEVYMIGHEIDQIHRNLGKGVALIGLQKKSGQALGLGGQFSKKRAKLYLTMGTVNVAGRLEGEFLIEKARSRANPSINPVGVKWSYKLINGARFEVHRKDKGHE